MQLAEPRGESRKAEGFHRPGGEGRVEKGGWRREGGEGKVKKAR
jgi:hypothetical protein